MTNNKQQTSVEWFIEELEYKGDLRETPSIRNIQLNIDTSDYMELKVQAKEMEKEQIRDAIKNELKLIGNYFDVSKLEQREQGHHIRFTSILKDRFDFYNETYGGNK